MATIPKIAEEDPYEAPPCEAGVSLDQEEDNNEDSVSL